MSPVVWIQLAATGLVLSVALAEALYLQYRKPGSFDWTEAWLSIADMVGRHALRLLPLNLAAPVFALVWPHRIFTIELGGFASFMLLFFGLEFCYYWFHRASHRVRFFWSTHAVHHSPNQLTLSTSFRLGWTGRMTGTLLFYTPLVYLGFDPRVIVTALSLNLLYQFWLHTTLIPKLGWMEWIFNTPSAHRVHHASNLDYLDANYGGVLIVFDRLFGTYRPERAEEPCVYGLVKPMRTSNVFTMEFSQWVGLYHDMRRAPNLRSALALLIMPPGWTPQGPGLTTESLRARRPKAETA